MDIRLIATDLDGTLLNRDKRIDEYTCRALRACEARGIKVVLASGRSFESVSALAKAAGLQSPIISANGAQIDASPNGETLFLDTFSRPMAQRVFELMMETGICFVIYGPGVMYQLHLNGYDDHRGLNRGILRAGKEFTSGGSIRLVRDEQLAISQGLDHALKFVMFSTDRGRLGDAQALLGRKTHCALSSSGGDNLEVLVAGGGKGRALAFLMGRFALSKSQVMAFGDSTNDIDMLGVAGFPVVMDNGLDEVKPIARRIAPSCDDAGVGRVLTEMILEGK